MIQNEDVLKVLVDKYGEENKQLFIDYIRNKISQTELNRLLIASLLGHHTVFQKA